MQNSLRESYSFVFSYVNGSVFATVRSYRYADKNTCYSSHFHFCCL